MPAEDAAPSAKDIHVSACLEILTIYPAVLEAFYQHKVKGDEKQRMEAREDDEWRYIQLPEEIRQRDPDKGLSKGELERLVKWKITHQTNRPFLLPQIRKNNAGAVERCTLEARNLLLRSGSSKIPEFHQHSLEYIRKALEKVCELSGVGPATGTLILSIYDSQNVPFFEDELYAWLFPGFKAKLKYNVKEYIDMLEKVRELSTSNLTAEDGTVLAAASLEKIAFVCQHWEHVSEEDRVRIFRSPQANHQKREDRLAKDKEGEDITFEPAMTDNSSKTASDAIATVKGKRKAAESERHLTGKRRSKRAKN